MAFQKGAQAWKLASPEARRRSVLSNDRGFLDCVDGRSGPARRYKDIVAAIATDSGDDLTMVKTQLVRRFAGAAVLAEALEAKLVGGEDIDVDAYTRLSTTLVRLASRIGLDRIPKDVTSLTLDDIGRDLDRRCRDAVEAQDAFQGADGYLEAADD